MASNSEFATPRRSKSILERVTEVLVQGRIDPSMDYMSPMSDQTERAVQKGIQLAREYYEGKHRVYLTKRQETWLDMHSSTFTFRMNHCPTVVDAVVERLNVSSFELTEWGARVRSSTNTILRKHSQTLWGWWQRLRLPALSIEVHRRAIRDGEAFLIVDWDTKRDIPRVYVHDRFVDKGLGGSGYGMWAVYENDDPLQEMLYAVKQWEEIEETTTGSRIMMKRTVYYPDRIEYKQYDRGKWVDREEPADWTDESGEPLGVPVIHFRNVEGRSELHDVIPIQDAQNKTWLDMLASADGAAFRMLFFRGFIPTTDQKEPEADGSNLLYVAPNQMIATTRPPDKADVTAIEPVDLEPILSLEDRTVLRIASVSDTPISRFTTTRQVADDLTLKQQEGPLLGKIRDRHVFLGQNWSDVIRVMLRLSQVFGQGKVNFKDLELEQINITTIWRPPEIRDERRLVEIALQKKELSVELTSIWKEMGYQEDEIEEMLKSEEYAAYVRSLEMVGIPLATNDGREGVNEPNKDGSLSKPKTVKKATTGDSGE